MFSFTLWHVCAMKKCMHVISIECIVVHVSAGQKLKLDSLAQTICTLYPSSSLVHSLLQKEHICQLWLRSDLAGQLISVPDVHIKELAPLEPSCKAYLSQCMRFPTMWLCATGKASDQPAHTRSLIRALASHLSIQWVLCYWYWLNIIWSSKA